MTAQHTTIGCRRVERSAERSAGPVIIALTKTSSHTQIASHIRAGLLRQLATAPLSEWPQALVQCLDSLAAYGVCHRSTLDGMMRPVVAVDPRSAAALRSRFDRTRKDSPSGIGRQRPPSPEVRRVCLLIRAHYDQRISLESLAARVGRNTAYMATLFHRQTGMTIHCYLTRVRMRRAGVWAALAFERTRQGEPADAAAERALQSLAAVDKTELSEADDGAYADAAVRACARTRSPCACAS